MVVIRRLATTLLALFILSITVIATTLFAYSLRAKEPLFPDEATAIAMKDPGVQQELSLNNVRAVTSLQPFNSTDVKGFLNFSNRLVRVHVALKSPQVPPPDYNYYFIVDADRGRVVDKTSFFDVMAGDDEITIPAGAAWYYEISRSTMNIEGEEPSVQLWGSYTPADASVYQVIVNRDGFERLRNASAGTPLYEVYVAEDTLPFNGTSVNGAGWNGTVVFNRVGPQERNSTPATPYRPDGRYYLAFINAEKDRDVTLTLRVPITGTIG